ncbi:nucleotide pyrophosphohydrolase [Polaribacter phage Freya_1]|uniref:NTP-PPase n=2 Tax=Freyavirus TaxID=2948713 RepID=A0A8E5E9D6_9CAUD|nr:nucleotide pyrophosphohydrolase [Polaribacter phage Danklef_1]YP_010356743.1 nucleotide pyrophosphohydrolase [Polaribacter phage Freya_1]QQV90600.1 NTP-PPase [Polaribacter phage Danklef_2]QQV90677.1 NTP-PPase [Polaribacter phage Danklef_3]QQV90753.1 NTP-PPase [Polaribacter phage Danklef_4]QQV90831.1 NTP-PPase [Polaribacter phage Danklef_5]QQV90991.1 NTP-PPase [Polaribacter phage Freya_2]QQV91059.1 NTP-PPase [Polaribacter phage Freya_3]QQV91127.1 NTP-PPase [Polaribacter phage Freya_4]QQV
MKKIIEKRLKFNKAFNLPTAKKPTSISHLRAKLQFDMMQEELNEYAEAENLTEVADSLIDMQEILLGMFAEHGLLSRFERLYNEVHKSNMSKLDDNGKPLINGKNGVFDDTRPIGKVIKSSNFIEPDFTHIINS